MKGGRRQWEVQRFRRQSQTVRLQEVREAQNCRYPTKGGQSGRVGRRWLDGPRPARGQEVQGTPEIQSSQKSPGPGHGGALTALTQADQSDGAGTLKNPEIPLSH